MVYIVLSGLGGELDRKEVKDPLELNNVMTRAVQEWTLDVGDTIRIVQDND